jgi:predicted DNA-binding protein YlxM (UPF0122 family)
MLALFTLFGVCKLKETKEAPMVIHKRTRLTPHQRKEIYERYYTNEERVTDLADAYHVSRPTIYKILKRGRARDFSIHRSTNARFRCLKYGLRRLTKIEKTIEERLKRQAKRLYRSREAATVQQGLSR